MNEGLAAWSTLFLLGAYHGINPGMGWLFAVARGIQEHRARAVAWSLAPIALGTVYPSEWWFSSLEWRRWPCH
jgi:threonine/homoserine/homoserine lactone efflux protein